MQFCTKDKINKHPTERPLAVRCNNDKRTIHRIPLHHHPTRKASKIPSTASATVWSEHFLGLGGWMQKRTKILFKSRGNKLCKKRNFGRRRRAKLETPASTAPDHQPGMPKRPPNMLHACMSPQSGTFLRLVL